MRPRSLLRPFLNAFKTQRTDRRASQPCPFLEALEDRTLLSNYYVSPSGSDAGAGSAAAPWATLNHAVPLLHPGDTLYLRGGTYNEALNDVVPSGSAGTPITLSAYQGETPVIKSPRNGTAAVYLAGRSYINFTGLTLDGSNLANQPGVPIVWLGAYTNHTTWTNCTLFGNDGSNSQNFFLGSGSSDAAGSNHVQFNTFLNCTVGGNIHESGSSLSHGWYLEGSDNTIDGCTLHDISADGVQTYSGSGATPSRNTVRNCTFTNVGVLGASGLRPALELYMGDANVAYNNVVSGCGWGATLGGTNGELYNNTIYNSSAQAIQFNSPSGAVIRNNVVRGTNGTIGSGGTQDHNWTNANADPKFVNPAAGDFELQAGSPLDGAGMAALSTTDHDGVAWGSPPAIGAYEYHPAASAPLAASAGPGQSANEGQAVSFQGSASGGSSPYSYAWAFGDGGTATGQAVSHTYANDGSYTATLTVTDARGASASSSAAVTVRDVGPTANPGGPYAGTAGTAVSFSGSASDPSPADTAGGFTYAWAFGDGGTAAGQSASHTYAAAGTYTVTLTVTEADGDHASATTTITVRAPAGSLAASAGPSRSASEGQAVTFQGTASGGSSPYSYAWNFGDGTTASGTPTPSHTYQDNGSYTATLTVTDAAGRTSSSTTTAAISNVAPTANANGPYSGVAGTAVNFTGSATDPSPADTQAGFTYAWDFGDGTTFVGRTPSHAYAQAGTYTATLTVTDKDGGKGVATTSVTIGAPASSAAHTYYVSTTGSDSSAGSAAAPFRTLHKGVSMLQPGDTLFIGGGTYAESLINVIPSGTASAPITLAAAAGQTPIIKPSSGSYAIQMTGASYVNFQGLTLDGSNLSGYGSAIVWLSTTGSVGSDHNRFTSCTLQGINGSNMQNFFVEGAATAAASCNYNQFINCVAGGNNASTDNHAWYVEGDYNVIDGCEAHDTGGEGIQIYMGGGVNGIDCSNNVVRNCKIHNAGSAGSRSGLIVAVGDGNIAYNNLLYDNPTNISVAYGATNTDLYNNTLYNSTDTGDANIDIGYNGGASNTTVRNNIMYGSRGADLLNYGSGTVADHNTSSATNPLFVNAAGHDFHLQAASPDIDQGMTLSAVTTDFDGVSRPQGAGYDIGACEYHG